MTEVILFLDVDGVLNNPMSESDFSDFNLGNFKNLVEKLSPKVVISSDWRRLVLKFLTQLFALMESVKMKSRNGS
jgi:hypothetical protein